MKILIFLIINSFLINGLFAQNIDQKASKSTRNLYANLLESSQHGIMFGHQDDLVYGIDWWGQKNKSDVKLITGDYPAVFGFDLGKIHLERNLDSVSFKDIKNGIKEAYKNKGIITLSWHIDNLVTGGSSWDVTPCVKEILPGGTAHSSYTHKLDLIADFILSCKTISGKKIPIIFRPFHEHNGNWFWWGKDSSTEEEYIKLWRFTVDYLRNEKDVHNLLYAFSPDRSRMDLTLGKSAYLYGYPGDDYVDIIGLDNYWDVGHSGNKSSAKEQIDSFKLGIQIIDQVAKEKGKIAALTETGLDGLEIENWFTTRILEPIKEITPTPHIAWVLVWRNANRKHFFVPYKSHKNENDFMKFKNDSLTLFQNDLDNLYKKRKR